MTSDQDIRLHATRLADEESSDNPQFASIFAQMQARDWQLTRTRASVLAGAAISQLPIWGFAMSFGVFQEYYSSNWTLRGSRSVTGTIGTTTNGVMYLTMPFVVAPFTRRWASRRQTAAMLGAGLSSISFLLSSWSSNVWHLVVTQGVLAALGSSLIYSTTTLSLGEWFGTSNRAVAYGLTLSCKNIVGSACPFLFRALLDKYGFGVTLRIWAGIVGGTSLLAILLIPTPPSSITPTAHSDRRIPWNFLRYKDFYVYALAITLQSSGYGIPQTYLSTYARDVTMLSQTSATLLLTIFNIPGIISSSFFGYLSDNKYFPLSATSGTAISALGSALSAFLLWGLTSQGSMAVLILFSLTFGFFAGGYSATWGGILKELELHASRRNEAIDMGMVYGLLNGARGVGYVSGGLFSVPLLKVGSFGSAGKFGYESTYGALIIYTGLSTIFGGWSIFWRC
ncbi:putative monocarboxylate transporter [Thelonectria olida]|uniref:Monocarboxylate transporter n=1 Tax=Thelonectria olida TaxID=1576542 RepID=A0A9P9AJ64_9HYPO|nr:putative monocarboxylate transporter [Thelonectria olida]